MTGTEVARLALLVLGDPAKAITAVAIAKAESNWNPSAVGDTTLTNEVWGPSLGLWQIRSLNAHYKMGWDRDAFHLKEPEFNARSMKSVSRNGTYWEPWSVYKNGRYKDHLDAATQAVRAAMAETAHVLAIRTYVESTYPGMWKNLGVYNRRYIAGTTTWSQHAWGNAIDLGVVSPTQMDTIVADLKLKKASGELPVGTILWRVRNHYDHAHVEGSDKRTGTPPILPNVESEDMTELIKKIQTALNAGGAQLTVDGVWGPKTHAAFVDALEGGQHTHEATVVLK